MDGVLEDTDTGTTAPEDSAGRLSVGRSGDFDGEYWTGLVDEVRVSNAAVYTASFGPPFEPLSSGASTVGLWHFDEGVGQTVADSSGNGRDGTLGADDGVDSDDPAWSTDSPVVCAAESDETTTVITTTYDALNRLTEAEYSDGTFYAYEYDAVGNRAALTTTEGTITTTYDAGNRLTNAGGVAYTHDGRGNLTQDGTFTYTYDAAGRLAGAESVTHTIAYTYNGDGVRMAMAVDGAETQFVVDQVGLPQVLVEYTPSGTTFYVLSCAHCTSYNRFVHSSPRLAQVKDGNAEWFLGDALGSVRQLVDDDGNVVLARDYAPYGQLLAESGTGSSGYAFTGEQWDSDAELLFLRARYYDPATGRFLSEDQWPAYAYEPISLNLYVYARDNALRYVDPSGYQIMVRDLPSPFVLDITSWPGWAKAAAFIVGQYNPVFPMRYEARYESGRTVGGLEAATTLWIEEEFRARGVPLEEPRIILRGLSQLEGVNVCLASSHSMVKVQAVPPVRPVGHHTVPREILRDLPSDVANHPRVRGVRGSPNVWQIPEDIHIEIHRGPGGGPYNRRWTEELEGLGHMPTVEDVIRIRDKLVVEFRIDRYRPN